MLVDAAAGNLHESLAIENLAPVIEKPYDATALLRAVQHALEQD